MARIGPYELADELGRGGMGVVYRARAEDGRELAIKLLLGGATADTVARFDRERRLLASLGEADGFVPILDAGTSPNGPWIAMPFVTGGTLKKRLKRGPMAIDEVIDLGLALAFALGKAHDKGIVHRDL